MSTACSIMIYTSFAQAWMEGMKTVLEPVIVILLSFAIGDATAVSQIII